MVICTYAISAYQHESCEFESHSWWGVINTTLCHKVCQSLEAGQWFSPVSSINKTDCHDITEILLKVALNTITLTLTLFTRGNQHRPTPVTFYIWFVACKLILWKCAWALLINKILKFCKFWNTAQLTLNSNQSIYLFTTLLINYIKICANHVLQ